MQTSASPPRKKVLLVDDHPILRAGLANVLGLEPGLLICGQADNPNEALRLAERERPDLAIIDLSLRSGDGIELIKDLRLRCPHARTLVLSMHDESVYAERALRAGARGYVMKQEKLELLLLAISRVLDGQIYVSEEVAAQAVKRLAGVNDGDGPTGPGAYVEALTDRELQVFRLIGRGLGTRLIAELLHLSRKTIESHRENIKSKLGLSNGSELVQRAIQWAREVGEKSEH